MDSFLKKYQVKTIVLFFCFSTIFLGWCQTSENTILIKNVHIYDGESNSYIEKKDLVIEGNKIKAIIPARGKESKYTQIIDGKGGYLSPGLIDVHWHAVFGADEKDVFFGDQAYVQVFSAKELEEQLMRGVTTIRDAAGNTFGLKRAIDEGVIEGPRIFPSGAMISQYSGHGDFRAQNPQVLPKEFGGPLAPGVQSGHVAIVTGVDQSLAATRQQLFLGATQIKIASSGGVSSFDDPLNVLELDDDEILAVVKAANDYGTYVMAHCHNPQAIIRSVKNGVKSIEHGSYLTEEAAKIMADNNVVYTPNFEVYAQLKNVYTDPIRAGKLKEANENQRKSIKYAIKYGLIMGFGTDLLFSYKGRQLELDDLKLRKEFFTSPQVMKQATGNGGYIVGLSKTRNPYGVLGVIKEGAMADILIYNKDFLKDVEVVTEYKNNLKLIIKDGVVKKNTLK